MSEDFTPLRSVLYMPSSNERALEKAKSIACDGLILDLEDAVAPDAKPAAREAACAAVASGEYGRRTVTIRVNSIGTEWHDDDLRAAAQAGPAAVVVPKVGSAAEVARLVDGLEKAGAPDHTTLWAMVETPGAILDALAIARPRSGSAPSCSAPTTWSRSCTPSTCPAARRSCPACTPCCWPAGPPASRSSTASTTTSRTPTASSPSAARAARWASTARP